MQLGQLHISVVCDGRALSEYRVEQQDAHTVMCFIPSEAGKAFEIHTTNSSAAQPVVGKLKLDGLKVRTFRAMPSSTHVADCVYLSQSVRRPFLFSNTLTAHLEDDDYVRPEADLMDSIGSIELSFFRCELGPETPWFSRGVKDISLGQFPVGYNAHQILLGTQQFVRNKRVSGARATLLDPKNWPYARFIFRYQSKEILQSHGIILSPVPTPVPQSLDFSFSTTTSTTTTPTRTTTPRELRRHTSIHMQSLLPSSFEPDTGWLLQTYPRPAREPTGGTETIRGNNLENQFMRAVANGQIAQHRRRRSETIR